MIRKQVAAPFYGWRVVRATFVLAIFGWGTGFYGPPIFLGVLHDARGWPISVISAAISVHFLVGAIAGATLYKIHRRLAVATTVELGALSMAVGLVGWGLATSSWQLFAAAVLTGAGWANMSAAALNAIVSPWFERDRPAALGMAYNGGSVGGILFSPLWVGTIAAIGFPSAAALIAAVMLATIWFLARTVFLHTPTTLGVAPDGDLPGVTQTAISAPWARPLPGSTLWRNRQFLTLAGAMTLGLFAQIGLMAHLYAMLMPVMGAQLAGLAMALITAMAIAGRTLSAKCMSPSRDRRVIGSGGYLLQMMGSVMLLLAGGENVALLVVGIMLFGVGFGNATSLPPLIAQVEFVQADVSRAAALLVGIAQSGYCIAPAIFGLIRETATDATMLGAVALIQTLAAALLLAGRHRPKDRQSNV